MINHIVIWRFKEAAAGKTKLENIDAAVALLDGCRDLVPGIERFEIVRGVSAPSVHQRLDVGQRLFVASGFRCLSNAPHTPSVKAIYG